MLNTLFVGIDVSKRNNVVRFTDSLGETHVLNAKQVKAFKEAYPELPKNDNIDTLIIADYLRFGRISKEVNLDEKYIALRNHDQSPVSNCTKPEP